MTLSVGQSIAIIAVCAACTFLLLVYCLRGMQFTAAGAWVPQVIAVGVTAGLHWWRRSTLLSIAAGTVCYMLLVQLVF